MFATFETAKEWYISQASNLQRAAIKIRMHHCYPDITELEEAFRLCVNDEISGKPLPR